MVGRPSKKIQCMATRKYDRQQCQAKGILKKNGRYLCRLHGGLSFGQKTIEGKINSIKNLKQYRNKTHEEIKSIITDNHRAAAAG